MGSIVHAKMLAKQNIISDADKDSIINGLNSILSDVKSGNILITEEYEDVHSFVEANLIDRIGDAGKKLHTGRSRNDQVALDMRLYTRDTVLKTKSLLITLLSEINNVMKENIDTYMPFYTSSESTTCNAGTSFWSIF